MGVQLMKHHLQSRVNAQILYVYFTIILNGRIRIILLSNFTPVSHSPSVLCCAPVHQSPVVKAIIPVQRTLSVHIYLLV